MYFKGRSCYTRYLYNIIVPISSYYDTTYIISLLLCLMNFLTQICFYIFMSIIQIVFFLFSLLFCHSVFLIQVVIHWIISLSLINWCQQQPVHSAPWLYPGIVCVSHLYSMTLIVVRDPPNLPSFPGVYYRDNHDIYIIMYIHYTSKKTHVPSMMIPGLQIFLPSL